MTDSTGSSRRSSSFGATERPLGSLLGGFAICIAFGIAIAVADAHLRLPLHMPGWRGLIGMGLLVLARGLTGQPWGASLAALAAALAASSLGQDMRFGLLAYLPSGLVIDLVCVTASAWNRVLVATLAAALGNLAKLLVTMVSMAVVAHRAGGFALPVAVLSHLAFGAAGGALAAWIASRTARGARAEDR